MIDKLRRKFIFILMSIVVLILFAVFMSMFIGVQENSRRMSEDMLRQAILMNPPANGFRPPPNEFEHKSTEKEPNRWMPIIVAEIQNDGTIFLCQNSFILLMKMRQGWLFWKF